jgi:hypothetical protein
VDRHRQPVVEAAGQADGAEIEQPVRLQGGEAPVESARAGGGQLPVAAAGLN